jgi:hypothetical protein
MAETVNTDSLDLVWGADAIAKVIGRTKTQTYHLLATGSVPAKSVQGRWVASRSKLRQHFEGEASEQN